MKNKLYFANRGKFNDDVFQLFYQNVFSIVVWMTNHHNPSLIIDSFMYIVQEFRRRFFLIKLILKLKIYLQANCLILNGCDRKKLLNELTIMM
jgi:hypothetical protein